MNKPTVIEESSECSDPTWTQVEEQYTCKFCRKENEDYCHPVSNPCTWEGPTPCNEYCCYWTQVDQCCTGLEDAEPDAGAD